MIRPKGDAGRVVDWALANGWKRLGDARGHLRLLWPPTAQVVTIAGTPSDHRSLANTRADIQRISGIEPPRSGQRRKSHRRMGGSGFDLQAVADAQRQREKDRAEAREELALVQGWLRGLNPDKRRSPAEIYQIMAVKRRARELREKVGEDGND